MINEAKIFQFCFIILILLVGSIKEMKKIKNTTSINDEHFVTGKCSNEINCFLPYGVCIDLNTCMCMPDYANFQLKNKDNKTLYSHKIYCSYKKKKLIVAALLEFFFPFALGHFYVEHYTLAYIKLTINVLIYIFGYFIYWHNFKEDLFIGLMAICLLMGCVIPIWNIVDLILFFTKFYKDGNGVSLA